MHASYSNLSKEVKTGNEILVGQAFFFHITLIDQNSQNNVLINKSELHDLLKF